MNIPSSTNASVALALSCDAIGFDLDDTLIATFATAYARVCSAARSLQLSPPSIQQFEDIYGRVSFPECVLEWYSNVDLETFERAYREHSPRHPYRALVDGKALLEMLRARRKSVGLITNTPREKIPAKLAVVGLTTESFDHVISADDVGAPKPDPAVLHAWINASGRDRSAHCYIGDSPADQAAAAAAGIKFVAVQARDRIEAPTMTSVAAFLE
ncbi:MAG: HAD-IA family hydrolase [Phycisphaerales bacterium]|nr:HAD-IA family hydrolase [Hyphomonadaceae bacterium]